MAIDGKKLEEQQEVVQGTEQTEGTGATTSPSWQEQLASIATAAQDKANRDYIAYEEAQERTAKQRQAVSDALSRGTSLMGSLLQEQKPQYDEKKEKRLRNTAIAQSVGDMLSAAAQGIFAFNKKGAGYVPKVEGNSALKSIEAINEMQEEYRRRNEAWRGLDLKYKKAQADAEIEAARQLLTAYETKEEKARTRAYNSAKEARETYADLIKAGIRAEERAEDKGFKEEDREDRQAHTAALKALGNSGTKGKELTEDGYIYSLLRADETFEETTTTPEETIDDEGNIVTKDVTRTSKKPKKYTIEEANALGKYDFEVRAVKALMAQGKTMEDAVAEIVSKRNK